MAISRAERIAIIEERLKKLRLVWRNDRRAVYQSIDGYCIISGHNDGVAFYYSIDGKGKGTDLLSGQFFTWDAYATSQFCLQQAGLESVLAALSRWYRFVRPR